MSTSYLDIHIRLYRKGEILNFHVLPIPMFSQNTGAKFYIHASKALDVLDVLEKYDYLNFYRRREGNDGGCQLRGDQIRAGFSARILSNLMRSAPDWNQDAGILWVVMGEKFYTLLTSLVLILQSQKNLINGINTKDPTVADTPW